MERRGDLRAPSNRVVKRGDVPRRPGGRHPLNESFSNPLDLPPGDKVYALAMGRDGLLIGDAAVRSGTTRKSLRRYEAKGILPPPRRTSAGYRIYSHETLTLLTFVARARRLGFTLEEIRQIVSIKRSGRAPCGHVRDLVRRKTAELDRTLTQLGEVRRGLRALLERSRAGSPGNAAVCHCIEDLDGSGANAKNAVGKRATPPRRR